MNGYHDQDDVIGFCGDYLHPYGCLGATTPEPAADRLDDHSGPSTGLLNMPAELWVDLIGDSCGGDW